MDRRPLSFCLWLMASATAPADDSTRREYFESHIRPIFATHCSSCHGAQKQKGGLRLDQRDRALAGGESGKAIVPGRTDEGELLKAVRYDADGYRMPPTGKLPAETVAKLEKWIRDGAYWPEDARPNQVVDSKGDWFERRRASHWSWRPVESIPPPTVKNATWPRNGVDRFLLAKLESASIPPAADAGRATLLRRASVVLTGLPTSAAEVEAFLADADPNALERVVDRLLASPAFGERWARHWLDLVRYSETLGHEFDFDIPNAWRYRDYVVRTLNQDLPFNQFIVEHVAGDLLPNSRLSADGRRNESLLATGFWWFGEAKQAPVDVRAEQADHIDNQIDVLGKAFLGLTISCARCHDHKFDAITADDYYALYGFVKSTRYSQNSTVPTGVWRNHLAAHSRIEQETRKTLAAEWKKQIRRWNDGDALRFDFGKIERTESPQSGSTGDVRVLGDAEGGFGGWRRNGPAALLADAQVGDLIVDGAKPTAPFSLHAAAAFHSARWSRAHEGSLRSPTFRIDCGKLHALATGQGARFNVVVDNFAVIRDPIYGGLKARLDHVEPRWRTVDLSMWKGREAYVEFLDQATADLGDPKASSYPADAWFSVRQVVLSDGPPPKSTAVRHPPRPSAAVDFEDGRKAESLLARLQRLSTDAVERWRSESALSPSDADLVNRLIGAGLLQTPGGAVGDDVTALLARRKLLDANLFDHASAPVAEDGDGVDEAVFVRGNPRKLAATTPRRFLTAIDGSRIPKLDRGSGRLWLARRLVDPANTLVARVFVNRVWRHAFGRGLVESPDNFGALGEPPSHPELLDRLAVDFIRDGWSLKRLVRKLVLTRAFQLQSAVPDAVRELDPRNRSFGRSNVRRLDAEALRDAIVWTSGRRNFAMGGPGVPVFLDAFAEGRGKPASGPLDGGDRRSIYLGVRRNFPLSLLTAFDMPTPAGPVGKRNESNVPAQALILLNDPLVVDRARIWAKSFLAECSSDEPARIRGLYLTAFGRLPSDAEKEAAAGFLAEQRSVHRNEQRAWADLCHAMINAKEFRFVP